MKLLGYLEQFLDRDKGTVIAIANDGYIVENVAEWILELDWGRSSHFGERQHLLVDNK